MRLTRYAGRGLLWRSSSGGWTQRRVAIAARGSRLRARFRGGRGGRRNGQACGFELARLAVGWHSCFARSNSPDGASSEPVGAAYSWPMYISMSRLSVSPERRDELVAAFLGRVGLV